MLISNGTAINILLANNNKLLNDVLKETDNKTLNNIIKQDKSISSESIDAGKILKEVFESIKDGTKSNSTLENILKNSNLFKDLGNVSTNVSNLMNNIKDDESLQKFKPLLENFLKNFKDTSFDSLKEQIKNSGLFLENKLAQNSNIGTKLENTLQNISNLIKNIDTPQTKEINNLINNIVKNISNPTFSNTDLQANLKTLTSSLQNLNNTLNTPITQNLNTLTNELKSIINQGILVESKLENNIVQNQNINKNMNVTKIENTLQNISNLIKNIDTPQTKEINNLIDNIVKNISNPTFSDTDLQANLKTLISSLQNLNNTLNTPITQNLNTLTNELKTILENSQNQTTSTQIPQTQIKTADIPINLNNNQIQNQPNPTQNLNTLTNELKSIINQGILVESKLENNIVQNQNINNNTNITKLENTLQNISNLIKNLDTPQTKEINNLINNIVKNISNPTFSNTNLQSNLKTLTLSLQNLNNTSNTSITQNLNILDTKESINVQVKELLVQIKSDIVQNPNIIQNKNILPIIDNLLKLNDFFFKPQIAQNNTQISQNISNLANNLNTNLLAFSSNFEANLNPLLSALKDSLHSINPQNSQIQEHINTLIKKVETIIQEQISNPKQSLKLEDDFKAVLLKMQDELGSKTDIKSQENLRTINNLITQIDYHQLTSLVSNSNYVYIPFFWEMLEDGSIEMKQKDEDKFFCQINLTLKDFGKVDLMLSLYNENKIDMTIYAQREHFKIAIRDNMQKLKIALNDADLIPINIKLLDMTNEDLKDENPSNIYQQNYYDEIFGLQVDIKA